jgi:hypothetical protein
MFVSTRATLMVLFLHPLAAADPVVAGQGFT